MSTVAVTLNHQLNNFKLDIDFETPATGVTALFGHSGSGKTSILRAIAGLSRYSNSKVLFKNQTWQDHEKYLPAHHRSCGYVFQEASLFSHLSVNKNLLFGYNRIKAENRKIKPDTVIELLGLSKLMQRSTATLSGGERQRVAIGRALLTSPDLLLMDEPLSALDHAAKQSIYPYLETLHDELAIPSIYVSHDPNEVARLADTLVLIEQGKVIATGKAADLLSRLDLPLAKFEDATSIIEGTVYSHDNTYHLTTIASHGGSITVPRENLIIGKKIRIEIQARDVSLSRRSHSDTSISNILPVTVTDMQSINPSQMIIRLKLQDEQMLLSRITRKSAMAIGLHVNMELYAQVKSVALIH